MIKKILAGALLISCSVSYAANSIDYIGFGSQSKFSTYAQELTAALDYRPMVPAEPLGLTGFDIGVSLYNTKFNSSLNNVELSPVENSVQMMSVQAHKGLPAGIDIGVAYSVGLGGNITTLGYDISYAILDGGMAMPAVNIRYTSTTLSGVDVLSYSSSAIELGVSKGFAMLTPYASIAQVSSTVTPNSRGSIGLAMSSAALSTVNSSLLKTSFGVNVNLTAFDLLVDMTTVGDISSTSFKLGFRF